MNENTAIHRGIEAALASLHQMLVAADYEVFTAREHIRKGEQNTAIGAAMPVKEALEQSLAVYHAILAMHRFNLKGNSL
ncbi:MAG: hypothetical protein ACREJD_03040 [Phycisphaerales bacterium]